MVKAGGSPWRKNRLREVSKSIGRFLAILAIVALGVGLFSGLKITRADMLAAGDRYVSDHHMYDYRLVSTLGLTEDDAEAIAGVPGVAAAEGAQSADFIATLDSGKETVLHAMSLSDTINTPKLTAGRMPAATDECLADALYFTEDDIGKTIVLSDENSEDTADSFAVREFTVVGLADSVLYLNIERGTTSLPGGQVDAFVFLLPDAFSMEYYTEIYVSLPSAGTIFSDAYDAAADAMEQPLTDALQARADIRHADLVAEAEDKIAEAQSEYDDALSEYETNRAETDRKLEDALSALTDAKTQLDDSAAQLSDAQQTLSRAQDQYASGLASYSAAQAQYDASAADTRKQLDDAQAQLDEQRQTLEAALSAAQAAGDAAQTAQLQVQQQALADAQTQLDEKKTAAQTQLSQAQAQLDATKEQLDEAARQISESSDTIASGQATLADGRAEYERNLADYNDARETADTSFAEAEQELSDAKAKIDDARDETADIPEADIYVLDRYDNAGYSCFKSDSAVVEGIAKVFPVFFFLVAALVCSTTMARMVAEQRTQTGTFKALGYSDGTVVWKFVSYAAAAAVAGCALGYFGGIRLFPYVIWNAYGMLYNFGSLVYVNNWWIFALSMAVSLACSAGVTYVTCRAELTRMPAQLMRPRAPKAGKRVLLERAGFIWNRLGFMQKVSIRNIFRYKRRLLMMALGIGGCTALLITGFGIRDSISGVADDQYGNIMRYDLVAAFSQPKSETEIQEFDGMTGDFLSRCVFVCADTVEIPTQRGVKTANVMATDDAGIAAVINMQSTQGQLGLPGRGEAAISDKMAKMAGVGAGDSLTLRLSDGSEKSVVISGVFKNYAYHYLIMSAETYTDIFGKDCGYSAALANVSAGDAHAAAARLTSDFDAVSVIVSSDIRDRVANMMKSLDAVVAVVIACAAALAFVVLFNLSNINITERIREIATIKVLGFYPSEVGAYVFRENIVLTAIGAAAGVPMGMWLHRFVMDQVDIDMVSFNVRILPWSFAVSLIITFVFTFTVDLIMRRKLAAIDMVESLKSVE